MVRYYSQDEIRTLRFFVNRKPAYLETEITNFFLIGLNNTREFQYERAPAIIVF